MGDLRWISIQMNMIMLSSDSEMMINLLVFTPRAVRGGKKNM